MSQSKTNKQKLHSFISRLIKKLNEGKPFTIQFNGQNKE